MNPVPGDVLTRRKIHMSIARRVVGVYDTPPDEVFFYESRRRRLGMLYCSLRRWRKWSEYAVVDKRGDNVTEN